MAINPIPVTFHLTAEPRPELIEEQRTRARPYRGVVQGVAIFAVMGVGFGYVMSTTVDVRKPGVASPRIPAAQTAAVAPQPVFPVWQPPAREPVRQAVVPPSQPDVPPLTDRTPVASIRDDAPVRPRGFAPVERAPHYSGFKVVAGD